MKIRKKIKTFGDLKIRVRLRNIHYVFDVYSHDKVLLAWTVTAAYIFLIAYFFISAFSTRNLYGVSGRQTYARIESVEVIKKHTVVRYQYSVQGVDYERSVKDCDTSMVEKGDTIVIRYMRFKPQRSEIVSLKKKMSNTIMMQHW